MIQREHLLQRAVKNFVRDAVLAEHEFFAFDRSKPTGRFTHLREMGRGIRRGTPDTLLRIIGLPCIWCELKAPGHEPTEDQALMGERLQALGDHWFWTTNVESYRVALKAIGVPLRPSAEFLAMHYNGQIASAIAKAERKAGMMPKSRRPSAPKPTARLVARVRAATGGRC